MEISYAKEHSIQLKQDYGELLEKEGFNKPESIIENLCIWARKRSLVGERTGLWNSKTNNTRNLWTKYDTVLSRFPFPTYLVDDYFFLQPYIF